jgi:hypothetical protein
LSWSPADTTLYALNQYTNGKSHLVTAGWIDEQVFTLEKTLGRLYPSPQDAAMGALYGCKTGNTDQFFVGSELQRRVCYRTERLSLRAVSGG